MIKEEQINFITLTLNKICEAELGQVNANKLDEKAIKTTDTKVIATELYEKGLQIVESDDVVISKYEYNFLKNNQKDGRPDGATNLLIKMHEADLLKEFVEFAKGEFIKANYCYNDTYLDTMLEKFLEEQSQIYNNTVEAQMPDVEVKEGGGKND